VSFKDARTHTTLAVPEVARIARVSPNLLRVTFAGGGLDAIPAHGSDHWFRLFLPHEDGAADFAVPRRMDQLGYLRYLRMPSATRPHMRNYTVRALRPEAAELDVDFVVHGDEGIATRWVQRAEPGARVAVLDQGRGYDIPRDAESHLLVGDETALPALAGILRDLPRDARGTAWIEVPDAADAQETDAPDGVEVRWITRPAGSRPGGTVLDAVRSAPVPTGRLAAYLAGEQALPAALRRWLVNDHKVAKSAITFQGYWRLGVAH
jgi:NADPH-dependent ferric siderophore reductase